MLNVGKIENGIVLDHIHAGRGMSIYHHMELSKMECPVAIIKNVVSRKLGKKDIIKIDSGIHVDFDVIGYVDPGLIEKKRVPLPKEIKNVIKCNNPRCITTIEQGIQHMFYLADSRRKIYRCEYCDEKYTEQESDW